MLTAAFASEIEGPELASPPSSISEDESSIKSFFSSMRETISSSLGASEQIKSFPWTLKLDIDEKSVPIFNPFKSVRCSWRLHANDTTGHFNPLGLPLFPLSKLAYQTPLYQKSFTPYFVVFAFVREARSPLPTIVFQFYGPARRMGNGTGRKGMDDPILTTPRQFLSDFGLSDVFWKRRAPNGADESLREYPTVIVLGLRLLFSIA
ncbi:hypothetical protein AVEN_218655-1 [Araneus ventricosus]|uniref:Uncharacterized protein n=1 Tax=Araneus ventricosus TaxID=182803 RepID=A0A4Y2B632_ARAVE|nr:hypothetical protein AVEN_218655-1 [Araneus ventricosus]